MVFGYEESKNVGEVLGGIGILAGLAAIFLAFHSHRMVNDLKEELVQLNLRQLRSSVQETDEHLDILESELQVHAKVHTEIWAALAREGKRRQSAQDGPPKV